MGNDRNWAWAPPMTPKEQANPVVSVGTCSVGTTMFGIELAAGYEYRRKIN